MPSIALYRWSLDPGAPEQDWAILSDDERARADRFYFPIHRRRFIAAHGRLRTILAAHTGLDPAALRFTTNPEGKPALSGPGEGLHFNLSHSHEMAILGVSVAGPLGVDIEYLRPGPATAEIANHTFAPAEAAALAAVPAARHVEAFFLCWTRKEAYIKAVGRGLHIPLDSFEVSLTPGGPARLLQVRGQPDEAGQWRLAHLEPAPGYVGAVAMRHPDWTGGDWL